jgi:hypothetical protein
MIHQTLLAWRRVPAVKWHTCTPVFEVEAVQLLEHLDKRAANIASAFGVSAHLKSGAKRGVGS